MSLHKWDFIRGVRDEQTSIALEKKRNRHQMRSWLMMAYMHQIIKEVKRQFQQRKDEIALHELKCENQIRITKAYDKMLQTRSVEYAQRMRKQVRSCLMFLVPAREELYAPPAADLMYRFISNVTKTIELESKIKAIQPLVAKRQEAFRTNILAKREKRAFLNEIFAREAQIMLDFYTSKGKGKSPAAKKYKALREKIKNIH